MRRRRPAPERFERRLLPAVGVALVLGGLVVARLVQVQVVEAGPLRQQATNQQQRTIPLPAARGSILDRDAEPLAVTLRAGRRGDRPAERLYPRGELASQVLGFVSRDGDGREGIELAFDRVLHGRDGSRVVGASGIGELQTLPGGELRPPVDGSHVVLTIDATAQTVLERELERIVRETGARSATAVLLDPRTGDILAMGSFPDYDPSEPGASRADHRRLRALTDLHEPGSTFKLVAAAACLEEGLADRGTLVESCERLELAGGHTLRDREDFGWVSLEEAIVLSINTATAQLARKLGPEVLFDYARAFGFGCVTGVDLRGEVSGILRRPAYWSGRSLETVSIGQEVAVTALQLASAYAAIANDGVLVKPRIVREIRRPDGKRSRTFPVRPVRRVVSRQTAEALTDILRKVVDEGTGEEAAIPGIPVAGKTGTAQWFDKDTGRYDRDRHVSLFAGFVPADAPAIAGVVVVDRPEGAGDGGLVAAPCFRRIVEGTLLARRAPMIARSAAVGREEG
jgi:cell division protein FtsI/penicillin-binding protein 2